MLSPLGALSALPYLAIAFAAATIYNVAWENPRIRAEARSGYVLEAEKAAAEAALGEAQRQARAALEAANSFNALLRQQAAELEAKAAADEKEQSEYEARIKAEKRSCPVSADDILYLNRANGVRR